MNILITGVAGFIGSNLAQWILNNIPGANVVGIDNLAGGYLSNVPVNVEFYKEDLRTFNGKRLFEEYEFDIVYICHCYAAEGLSPFIRKFNYENNIVSTVGIINNCIQFNVKRVVYLSSMSVYGDKYNPPFHEDLEYAPIDPYGISKVACELDLKVAGEQHGLKWTILRPHNCYSSDTEILTKTGFKLFKNIQSNDLIATLNPETKETEYHHPIEKQKILHKGEMIRFCREGIDIFVTPDHKMVLKEYRNAPITREVTAKEIVDHEDKYYKSIIMTNLDITKGQMYLGNLKHSTIEYDIIQYDDFVYDVTVPNHIIFVRRNGRTYWGSNCYGPKQNLWDKYRNVTGIWMYRLLQNESPLIYGDGNQKRAFSYIEDMLRPMWIAGTSPECLFETINLGGISEYSLNELWNALKKVTKTKIKPEYVESRHEVKHAWSTWEKSADLLGFEHKTNLKSGLMKMWEWAKTQPDREIKEWDEFEITKGLYEYWKR